MRSPKIIYTPHTHIHCISFVRSLKFHGILISVWLIYFHQVSDLNCGSYAASEKPCNQSYIYEAERIIFCDLINKNGDGEKTFILWWRWWRWWLCSIHRNTHKVKTSLERNKYCVVATAQLKRARVVRITWNSNQVPSYRAQNRNAKETGPKPVHTKLETMTRETERERKSELETLKLLWKVYDYK